MIADCLGLVTLAGVLMIVVNDMMQSLRTGRPAMWTWWRPPCPTLSHMNTITRGFNMRPAYTGVRLKTAVLAVALCSGHSMRLLGNTVDGNMALKWTTVFLSGVVAHTVIAATRASHAAWIAALVTLIGPGMCMAAASLTSIVPVVGILVFCAMVVLCVVTPFVTEWLRVAAATLDRKPGPAWINKDPTAEMDPAHDAVYRGCGPEGVTEQDFVVASTAYALSALGPYVLMLANKTGALGHGHEEDGNVVMECMQVLTTVALVLVVYTLDVTSSAVGMHMLDDAMQFLWTSKQAIHKDLPPAPSDATADYVEARTRWVISYMQALLDSKAAHAMFNGQPPPQQRHSPPVQSSVRRSRRRRLRQVVSHARPRTAKELTMSELLAAAETAPE